MKSQQVAEGLTLQPVTYTCHTVANGTNILQSELDLKDKYLQKWCMYHVCKVA